MTARGLPTEAPCWARLSVAIGAGGLGRRIPGGGGFGRLIPGFEDSSVGLQMSFEVGNFGLLLPRSANSTSEVSVEADWREAARWPSGEADSGVWDCMDSKIAAAEAVAVAVVAATMAAAAAAVAAATAAGWGLGGGAGAVMVNRSHC